MDRYEKLQDVLERNDVKICYVSPQLLYTNSVCGHIYVDNLSQSLIKALDDLFLGGVRKKRLSINSNEFSQAKDRTAESYCVPNFLNNGCYLEKSVKSQKERFIRLLKNYEVKNCYVSPGFDLEAKEPSGKILVDTQSSTLIEELYWLYTTPVDVETYVDQSLGIYFSKFKIESEEDLPEWNTPNFVIDGRYVNA